MKVCVVGGGNIGTAISAIMSSRGHSVTLKTGKPERWKKTLCYTDMETRSSFWAELDRISDSADAVANADIVFITVPSFSLKNTLEEILPYLQKDVPIGVLPGTGGVELIARRWIEKGYVFFGTDRVPCIARVTEYGRCVSASKKNSVRLCALPKKHTGRLCRITETLFGMECNALENYLTVTLTPSNPILHTARLYALYQSAAPLYSWDSPVPFYEAWNRFSSEMLIACDGELQTLCRKMDKLDLRGVLPLTVHYESETAEAMTRKISGILSFRGILSPMILQDGRYVLDLNSRYFTEDFPYGLCIIKGFAELFSCNTPSIDTVLKWYESLSGREYFTESGFNGKDLINTAVPQIFGIKKPQDVWALYC